MVVDVRAFVLCVVLAKIPAISMSCSGGTFPDENQKCMPCPRHCLFCDSNTKCLSCEGEYWGTVCENPCSTCQTNTSCEKTNGFCLEACRDGYSGVLCETLCNSNCSTCNRTNKEVCLQCASGRYPAVSCDNICSTCDKFSCDEKGVCTHGCKSGYTGIKCDEKERNRLDLIMIFVAVALITAISVVVVVIIWRKRRSNNLRSADQRAPEAMGMIEIETVGMSTSERTEASTKNIGKIKTGSKFSKHKKYTSKKQNKLYEIAKSIQNKTDEIYLDEWGKLPTEFTTLSKECLCEDPPGELEQQRIGPYEFNKVIVEGKDRQYFNASYIVANFVLTKETLDAFSKLPREEKGRKTAYIACIGPTPEYRQGFGVFWRMVWQENCQTIVMLNTLNKKGNEQYWPDVPKKKTYDGISVDCKTEQRGENYIIRSFSVTNVKQERIVNQFQYSAWPERGRVVNTENLLEFCKAVQNGLPTGSGPVLVHGRAGVGRTGTFIALDMLWKAAEDMLDSVDKLDDKSIDIRTCVENLRKQRTKMVETVEQYKFLHEAIAQVIMNLLDERGYQKKIG